MVMSNAASARALDAGGAGQLVMRLTGPAAYGLADGPNVGSLTNAVGDLRLLAAGAIPGLSVQAGTGNVGVGTFQPAYPLDVSGAARATVFVDPSGNRLFNNAVALWATGATSFARDDGTPLDVGTGGTLSCRYFWFGAMVTVEIKMVLGAAPALGVASQGWRWSLPVPPAVGSMDAAIGSALMRNTSAGGAGICYTGVATSTPDGAAVKVYLEAASAVGVTLATPFAWGAGDTLSLLLSYEAAAVQQPASALPVGFTQSATAGCNCLGLGLAPGPLAALGSLVVAGTLGVGGVATPAYAVDVSGGARFTGALVAPTLFASNVAILGALTTVNAYETHSSNVVIANLGTGPALSVSQVETGPLGAQPVAVFRAGSNVALLVDAAGAVNAASLVVASQATASNVVTGGLYAGSATFAGPVTFAAPLAGTAATWSGALQSSNVATGPLAASTLTASNVVVSALYSSALGGCISDALALSSSTVAASATALSNVNVTLSSALALAAAALPRAGGVVSGPLACSNLAILGTLETVNAFVTNSSNVVIANYGTGPALSVTQTETFGAQPVASFYAGSNVALLVTGAGALAVGQTTAAAGVALDVSGVCRATAFQLSGGGALGAGSATGWASSTASNLYSAPGSNVGVGKAPGAYALDVSGALNVSGLTTHGSNVGIGRAPTSNALDVVGIVSANYYRQSAPVWFQINGAATGSFASQLVFTGTATGPAASTYNTSTGVWSPTVAGMYMLTLVISGNSGDYGFFKNGAWLIVAQSAVSGWCLASGTMLMNGTTDYGTCFGQGGTWATAYYFQAVLLFAT